MPGVFSTRAELSPARRPVERRRSEQEQFWAGEFGNEYIERQRGPAWDAANLALFAHIFERTREVGSVLEFGANVA